MKQYIKYPALATLMAVTIFMANCSGASESSIENADTCLLLRYDPANNLIGAVCHDSTAKDACAGKAGAEAQKTAYRYNAVKGCSDLGYATACSGGGQGESAASCTAYESAITSPPAPTYNVGGTLSGLAGTGLVLQNNLGDDLPLGADGSFTFTTKLLAGASYTVTVLTQPAGPAQLCTVSAATGTISTSDVANITVSCIAAPPYSIGGNASGLTGTVTLQNNAGDNLDVTADGAFTFNTTQADTTAYKVTVLTPSPAQTCSINSGVGVVATANVTTVVLTCNANAYNVGGTIAGLAGTLVLRNNDGDDITLTANAAYNFSTPVADLSPYAVTVVSEPTEQTCTPVNAIGALAGADITNVDVTCTVKTYNISGNVVGLGGSVTLQNNGGNDIVVAAAGPFGPFPGLVNLASYAVTVSAQPAGETCVVTNGSGVIDRADVTNVTVTCEQSYLIADLNGTGESYPKNFMVANTNVYFEADDGTGSGNALWVTDTSVGNATLLKDLVDDAGAVPDTDDPSVIFGYATIGTSLYFTLGGANFELWESTGTGPGTTMVSTNAFGDPQPGMLEMGGILFYFAKDSATSDYKLWRSDGTTLGTVVAEDCYNTCGSPIIMNGDLYFYGTLVGQGTGLFRTNGTVGNATLVSVVQPKNAIAIGTNLFFGAYSAANGEELWISDGTPGNTNMVLDLNTQTIDSTAQVDDVAGWAGGAQTNLQYDNHANQSCAPGQPIKVGDTLTIGAEILTVANITHVVDDSPNPLPSIITSYLDFTTPLAGAHADNTSFTVNSTETCPSTPRDLIDVGGTLFFTADNGTNGRELWTSNGTPGGTLMVTDINAGATSSIFSQFAAVGTDLFFTTDDGTNGVELWTSNGTVSSMVQDINPTGSSTITNMLSYGGLLYFVAPPGGIGAGQLWSSTTGAATQLTNALFSPQNLTISGAGATFVMDSGGELWRFDP